MAASTHDKTEVCAKEDNSKKDTPADFETALDAVGFGRYHIFLLLVALCGSMGSVFETTSMSYIVQSAECDLNLTLLDKGTLNAITYAGMISSAIFWGFIADTKGRRKILVYGFLIDVICVLGSALSQNVTTLMIFKYLGGFVVSGPFAVLMTYLTELHGRQHRARVMMAAGIMFSIASLVLPALALAILPNLWSFHILGLTFHSWQLFLAVSATPSLISGLLLLCYPESPKFLMSQGRNAEALEIFKTMYAMNKRQPRDNYPIKELIHEVPEKRKSSLSDSGATITIATIEGFTTKPPPEQHAEQHKSMSWHEGLLQLRPLFRKPYLSLSLRVYLLNMCLLLGQNTMRLWLPQLFGSITEYEDKFHGTQGASTMCAILEYSVNKTSLVHDYASQSCEVVISSSTYLNNIIVALAGFSGYIVAVFLVNLVGGKWIMTFALVVAGASGISLYWSASTLTTLIISSIFVTMGSIAATSVVSASASLFPTSLRTMVVSMTLMFGRSGSITGNILFPIFISAGCIPPFVMLSFVMLFASILAAFLPNTKKTVLK